MIGRTDLELFETMRWEGSIRLLEDHLARLARSASELGFALDEDAVRRLIARTEERLDESRPFRIRVRLRVDGAVSVQAVPLRAWPGVLAVSFASSIVDSRDPWLRHKTSRRSLYDRALAEARKLGLYDLLFVNQRGEVTEGSRSNVLVRTGEQWVTPPVSCGLLPGVYRSHFMAVTPNVVEGVLTRPDLLVADEVRLCNALRGLVSVRVIDSTVDLAVDP